MRNCLGNLFKLGARLHLSFNYAQKRLLQNRALDGGVRNIFDRKVKQIQKQRAVLSPDGHIFEYLKEEVACSVVDRIADVKRSFPLALDLGCGKGFLAKSLAQEDGVSMMLQGDLCKENVTKAYPSLIPCEGLSFDEENLPFRDNTFDLVLTSLSLHWVNDLQGYFSEVLRILKPDGCFIGAMFGSDTLFELRCSLQLAETEREGGIAPHVSPMMQGHQLANLLSSAKFNLVTLDFDQLVVNYPSMFELMEDLQGMGESNALLSRKMLHRDTIIAASAIYQAMYGDTMENFIPATFQLLHMIGWKPHETQQKPLERGAVPKGFNAKEKSQN
ncbi:arginine-hydroxylase NDUFAF5, mitochondrial-like [Clavelina lepadiformis]|uniref:arginine-hydroxylase NDUFAF5, mitochondrial-like n=1 Tax=Clavelina lepadiformis TaxID=159417 RepID=UPI004042C3CB